MTSIERQSTIAAWCLAAASLFFILQFHLLTALLTGLLVHQLVHLLARRLKRGASHHRGKQVALALLVAAIVLVVTALVFGAVAFFRSDAGDIASLLNRMAQILDGVRGSLPPWVVDHLPEGVDALKESLSAWLREHAAEFGTVGKQAGLALAHILIGLVIGAMISLQELRAEHEYAPLARALIERARRLGDAFRRIVFAQLKISAINASFTAIYLTVVLPAFGVHLPLTKTMIAVTFIVGLLPVIGNLISNTVIVVVSLAHSIHVALGSLAFLVVIHKLEYFLNARIVGGEISARAWELLLAMLAMEAAFGLPGVVAGPIFYAYLKDELRVGGLI